MKIKGVQYIGYTESSAGSDSFQTWNPRMSQANEWTFFNTTDAEANQAAELAALAFMEYSRTEPEQRARFLENIAREIELCGDEIKEVYCRESGLPAGRAQGELNRTLGQLRMFAEKTRRGHGLALRIDTADPHREPMPKPDLRKMSIPLGPVVVFGASNFPLAYSTAGGDTASALAAGCPVIVKGHPLHAGTGELVASAVVRAAKNSGMPDGVFSHLHHSGHHLGAFLAQHPKVRAIGFTGSQTGGRALMDIAGKRPEPIPVFSEMGSINPVVLLPGALKNKGSYWAQQYASSITLGVGQFCTNPGLLIGIKGDPWNAFVNDLSKGLEEASADCMLHPSLRENYDTNRNALSQVPGTEVLLESSQGVTPAQLTQISGASFLSNARAQQEVFGPASLLVACRDYSELKEVLSQLEGQLTGSLLFESEDRPHLADLQEVLGNRVGRLIYNGVPTGVEVCDAMQHGGPYPASTDVRFGAVGGDAIHRWLRPLSFQNCPEELLPIPLQNANPAGFLRLVNGEYSREAIS